MTDPASGGPRSALRTFLLADVRGYTRFTEERGDEAAGRLAGAFTALTREEVQPRGGDLLELRGDSALVAFTSVRQAVRSALAMQARFAEARTRDPSLPIDVGIGLDAGEAVPVEGGYRGGSLNLAARLCSVAAPGEILASQNLMHLARAMDDATFFPRGSVTLKGFAEPVEIVQVVPPGTVPRALADATRPSEELPPGSFLGARPEGHLVGRKQELERINAALDRAVHGEARLLLLGGEPGVGKTRLAQELTLAAHAREFLVVTGRCYEPHEQSPFYPFLEALSLAFRLAPPSLQAQASRRWTYLGRLLPEGSVPVPASGPTADRQEEKQRLFWAVSGFLQALAAERPVAVILDDLHWADRSSLELLQHLARRTYSDRILLAGTYRDVELGPDHPLALAIIDLGREHLVERLTLSRLDHDATGALMTDVIGADVPHDLVNLVFDRTAGNPFFTQEVLHSLIEGGAVQRHNGRWEIERLDESSVPESVRAVIGQRLARLGDTVQETLESASVLGQEFLFDDLQGLTGESEPTLEHALETAEAAGVVRESEHDAWIFSHALVRQALYAGVSGRRKRRLHRAAGDALERLPESLRTRRAGEIAQHLRSAGDDARALPYLILAGDRAEQVAAHGEAEWYYRAALEVTRGEHARATDQPTGQEVSLLERLGGALKTQGRYDEALALLEEAAGLYRSAHDAEGEVRTEAAIGQVHFRRGTAREGIERIQPVVGALESGGATRGLAALYSALSQLYFVEGNHHEQLAATIKAVTIARRIADDEMIAAAEVQHGLALSILGHQQEARPVLENILPLAKGIDTLGMALLTLAEVYELDGDVRRSQEFRGRLLDLAERTADPAGVTFALSNLGVSHFLLGDWTGARRLYERAARTAGVLGPSWVAAYPPLGLGELDLAEGYLERASTGLEQCLRIAGDTHHVQALRYAQRVLAMRDILAGRPDAAVTRLEPVLADLEAEGMPAARFYPVLAQAHLETGAVDAADSLVRKGLERVNAQGDRVSLLEMRIVQAALLRRRGSLKEAGHVLDDILAVAHAMTYPYAEARILRAGAALSTEIGEREAAADRLRAALAIFRELGARRDLEEAEKLLALV